MTVCQYSRIGCPWQGPFHEQKEHERNCIHPHNTGAQVLQALDLIEQSKKEEKLLYQSIIEFLSFEKVDFHGNWRISCSFKSLYLVSKGMLKIRKDYPSWKLFETSQ